MIDRCVVDNCDSKIYNNENKCILHCEKNDSFNNYEEFNKELKEYIKNESNLFNIELKHIYFPEEYSYNFIFDFDNLQKVSFSHCIFFKDENINKVEPKAFSIHYYNCVFNKQWSHIHNLNITYNDCTFNDKIYLYNPYDVNKIDNIELLDFSNCTIKQSFHMDYSTMDKCPISQINIQNTIFHKEFKINNCNIEYIILYHNVFKDIVELNDNILKFQDLTKNTFNSITSFLDTTFKGNTNFEDDVFEKLVLFRNATFMNKLNLENTIFKDEANFLNLKNKDGNKLEAENIENRETARIIKHSFDKIGNIIEANKYYAFEMEKREEELKFKDNPLDWLVFKLHKISSNHSQNWILPLLWIFIIGINTYLRGKGYLKCKDCNQFFTIFSNVDKNVLIVSEIFFILSVTTAIISYLRQSIMCLVSFLFLFSFYLFLITHNSSFSSLFQQISPFSKLGNDMTAIDFIAKVIITYLIYQFVISIRQNTRRK